MCNKECSKSIEVELIRSTNKAVVHEQQKTTKAISRINTELHALDTKVEKIDKETMRTRYVVIVFGILGVILQIIKG